MFFWIFAAVGLVLVFAPPRFRKIGFILFGGVFILFLVIVVLNRQPLPPTPPMATDQKAGLPAESRRFDFDKYQQEKRDREDPDARTRIPVSEVRFDQVQSISGIDAGTIQAIRARLYNDSKKFILTDYSYYLVIQDCLPATSKDTSDERCTAVYDQHDSASLTVPPNQARDVLISIPKNSTNFTAPFKLLGVPRIELKPTDTRAYQ
jgi:hypothetical protein